MNGDPTRAASQQDVLSATKAIILGYAQVW